MGNNNSQTKAKGMISRGVGHKELEISLSTTVFWDIYSNRHAILARKPCLNRLPMIYSLYLRVGIIHNGHKKHRELLGMTQVICEKWAPELSRYCCTMFTLYLRTETFRKIV